MKKEGAAALSQTLKKRPQYVSTTNACKLCTPMGAAIAFRGIEGAVPFLHGSQGCATYMRRYIISHYNEPIDIASSSLGEKNAVFGGGANLKKGLANVSAKYRPAMIGIATTCLTETIGDDVAGIVAEYLQTNREALPPVMVHVATPSYSGTHMDGFHAALRATVEKIAEKCPGHGGLNVMPGFVSPADLRLLKEIMRDFGLAATILPDIADTLDGPAMNSYPLLPPGGTPLADIARMGGARLTIEFGLSLGKFVTAGDILGKRHGVPLQRLGTPIGIHETDRFLDLLAVHSGRPLPEKYRRQRGRLVDAYVDGHKYVAGKKAVVYGEEDLVVGLSAFLAEIGVRPVLCASGGTSGNLAHAVAAATAGILAEQPVVLEDADFYEIEDLAADLAPDIVVGHSKGYAFARRQNIPLIRVGFPIHDRLGGQRILHLGYAGAQTLFDTVVNALIEKKQDDSPVGYSYM